MRPLLLFVDAPRVMLIAQYAPRRRARRSAPPSLRLSSLEPSQVDALAALIAAVPDGDRR